MTRLYSEDLRERVGALCGWRDDTSDRSGAGDRDRPVVRAEMGEAKAGDGLGCAGSDRRT